MKFLDFSSIMWKPKYDILNVSNLEMPLDVVVLWFKADCLMGDLGLWVGCPP